MARAKLNSNQHQLMGGQQPLALASLMVVAAPTYGGRQ